MKRSALAKLKSIMGVLGHAPSINLPDLNTFLPINVDQVRRDLKVIERAQENGSRNEPDQMTTTLDDVENNIVLLIDGERGRCAASFENHLETYDERLNNLHIEDHATQVAGAVRGAVAEFIANVSIGKDELVTARRGVAAQTRYLTDFREKHALKRPAHYPQSRVLGISIILLMLVFESAINGIYFAEGSELALLGGVSQALFISLINIMSALILSLTLLRWIWHISPVKKIVGAIALCAYLPTIFCFNLFVAHFRDLSERLGFEEARTLAVRSFVDAPFALESFESWMLLIVGNIFAIVALIDGYKMDDPYPGYGTVDRLVKESEAEYAELKSELVDELRDTRDEAVTSIDALRSALKKRAEEHGSILSHRHRLIQNYKSHHKHLEIAGRQLLAEYRSENRKHRSSPPPAHFNDSWNLTALLEPPPARATPEDVLSRLTREANSAAMVAVDQLHSAFESAVGEYQQIEQIVAEN